MKWHLVDASVLAELVSHGPSKGAKVQDAYDFIRNVFLATVERREMLGVTDTALGEYEAVKNKYVPRGWEPTHPGRDPALQDDPYTAALCFFNFYALRSAVNIQKKYRQDYRRLLGTCRKINLPGLDPNDKTYFAAAATVASCFQNERVCLTSTDPNFHSAQARNFARRHRFALCEP